MPPEPFVRIPDAEWAAVLWWAQRHRVLLHLASSVDERALANTSPQRAEGLRGYRHSAGVRALASARESCLLQRACDDAAVSIVMASGWALGEGYYVRREAREVDHQVRLVVDEADRQRAAVLLKSLGYAEGPRDPLGLLTLGRSRVALDTTGDDTGRTRVLTLDGTRIRVPGPESWLLRLLAPRGARPRMLTLERACDVVSLIEAGSFDWDACFRLAVHRRRLLRVRAGITAACRLLDRPVPRAVSSIPSGARDRRAAEFLESSAVQVATPRARVLASRLKSVAPDEQGSVGRYSPSPDSVIDRMMICAKVSPQDVVLDLGCGDGRVAIRAAQRFGALGIGVDRDRALIQAARTGAAAAGQQDRTRFIEGDLFEVDLTQATVICLYLQRFAYRRLAEWLRAHARPGTRIVSHDVGFPDWLPASADMVVSDLRTSIVYCWSIQHRTQP